MVYSLFSVPSYLLISFILSIICKDFFGCLLFPSFLYSHVPSSRRVRFVICWVYWISIMVFHKPFLMFNTEFIVCRGGFSVSSCIPQCGSVPRDQPCTHLMLCRTFSTNKRQYGWRIIMRKVKLAGKVFSFSLSPQGSDLPEVSFLQQEGRSCCKDCSFLQSLASTRSR